MENKYLVATDLGAYYHLSCQLSLWTSFHKGKVSSRSPVKPSARVMAAFSRGNEWERHLVQRLDQENLILRVSNASTFQSQLEDDYRNHFYVIGASFKDINLFADEYRAHGHQRVAFGTLKPDFIEVWKRIENGRLVIDWHVIDAKATKAVKVLLLALF